MPQDGPLAYTALALLLACTFGLLGSILATEYRRPLAGFLLGFFFGPLGIWLVTALPPDYPMRRSRARTSWTYTSPMDPEAAAATSADGPNKRGETALRVRRVGGGDEAVIRALRLEALSDSPEQFASTLERDRARTHADWARWLSTGATFLVDRGGTPRGLVAATVHDSRPGAYYVESMWVHPEERGGAAADHLMDALQDWAEGQGVSELWLEVVEDNVRARHFYQDHGFVGTGGRRTRDGRDEIEMRFDVAAHVASKDRLAEACDRLLGRLRAGLERLEATAEKDEAEIRDACASMLEALERFQAETRPREDPGADSGESPELRG
jgi:ribosomal protein S18 acetylase RimI-like enzyme